MLGCKDHEGHAVECVRPCREYGERRPVLQGEMYFHAVAFPDPVLLHAEDLFRPAGKFVAIFVEFVRIFGDREKPLRQFLLDDLLAAPPAIPVFDLLIGKDGLALRAES